MRTAKGYFVGHLEGSVGELTLKMAGLVSAFPWALVRSVDSLMDLRQWDHPLKARLKEDYVGNALLMSGNDAVTIARASVFSGFDEVWFLAARPSAPPPPNVTLVGPYDAEKDDMSAAVEWAIAQQCEIAVGDGIGLNYIAKTERATETIRMALAR